MPINLEQDLKLYGLSEPQTRSVEAWIRDYEAMPDPLRLYMDMFIALLPERKQLKCPVNRIKVACESRWGLYYPKTVWFVGLRLNGFITNAPVSYASGVLVNTDVKHIRGNDYSTNVKIKQCLWLPHLYEQWEEARGTPKYAS
jgi:hypothetical protein